MYGCQTNASQHPSSVSGGQQGGQKSFDLVKLWGQTEKTLIAALGKPAKRVPFTTPGKPSKDSYDGLPGVQLIYGPVNGFKRFGFSLLSTGNGAPGTSGPTVNSFLGVLSDDVKAESAPGLVGFIPVPKNDEYGGGAIGDWEVLVAFDRNWSSLAKVWKRSEFAISYFHVDKVGTPGDDKLSIDRALQLKSGDRVLNIATD
jgi:hypothetical protein